ncbi:DUF4397 domain-containing protein [Pleionea sp. CnH1-48]|uniref:DUF4397 domain-containing protein n=1 Tax=Pleionea sp. CnH1-48 TaxID=2954494 RepID=UPI0020984A6E|nr:DUF4397 domain-containing protein [Pleionea sp. CnH1-48]MCO7227446.1 DUF4397 domain-containing protein [Pleionea sp. CnH1-48]
MFLKQSLSFVFSLLLFVLVGCDSGSDDDATVFVDSYVHFYNASPNASDAKFHLDDQPYSSADFGDVTILYTVDENTYNFKLTRKDNYGDDVDILEDSVTLRQGVQHLFIMTGDFRQPELMEFDFTLTDVDDGFVQLHIAHLAQNLAPVDVYISSSTETFADAEFLASLDYKGFSSSLSKEAGDYIVYLTDSGSDNIVFQSEDIILSELNRYVLALREDFGPGTSSVALDRISNSSSVIEYQDINEAAQYRVYNSIDAIDNVDFYRNGLDNSADFTSLNNDVFSDYMLSSFGDFTLSMTEAGNADNVYFRDLLLTLNYADSKSVVVYNDEEGLPSALSFEQDVRPLAYQSDANLVNIIADYSQVNVYFVRSDETLDTATYTYENLDFTDVKNFTLPTDTYEIYLIYEDENENRFLLYRSEPITLQDDINYTFIAEPDAQEVNGFKVNIL